MMKFLGFLLSAAFIAVFTTFAVLTVYPSYATPQPPQPATTTNPAPALDSSGFSLKPYSTDQFQTSPKAVLNQAVATLPSPDTMVNINFLSIVVIGLLALILGLVWGVNLGKSGR